MKINRPRVGSMDYDDTAAVEMWFDEETGKLEPIQDDEQGQEEDTEQANIVNTATVSLEESELTSF